MLRHKKYHIQMRSTSEKIKKEINWTRWIARILSSFITLIWGWWFIGSMEPLYFNEERAFIPDPEEFAVFIFFIIVLAGTIIGWWSEKWGGVVLIVGYLANAIGGYILAVSAHNTPAAGFIPVIMFIPFLISGILYILFWGKNRKSIKVAE